MFKLIKKFFQTKQPIERIELKIEENTQELEGWLNQQAAKLNFQHYFTEYLKQVSDLKSELLKKAELLLQQEISETDRKQVNERVKNIVIGHRDHYTQEIKRFSEKVLIPAIDLPGIDFKTIEDYDKAIQFNKKLDEELNLLAKRTAKSYQAAQHLFFDSVENLFKLLGKLTTLVKNFKIKVLGDKIDQLAELKQAVSSLNENIDRKKIIEQEIKNKNEDLTLTEKSKSEKEKRLKQLIESKDYQQYLILKNKEDDFNQQDKDLEYKVFSFFSKLSKALKKQERLVLDNAEKKLINAYLDDSVHAFRQDVELKIIVLLEKLKLNLLNNAILLDEKQKNNVLELIEKSKQGYLLGLQHQNQQLQQEKETLTRAITENKTSKEAEELKHEIGRIASKIESLGKEIAELSNKLEKIEIEKTKQELVKIIKEIFKKEIIL